MLMMGEDFILHQSTYYSWLLMFEAAYRMPCVMWNKANEPPVLFSLLAVEHVHPCKASASLILPRYIYVALRP
jgi:hypothetical protein